MLTHYPTITANADEQRWQATINLHGHTHQTVNFTENYPFMYHVGVDSHWGYPVLLDNVITEMEAHWKNLEMRAKEEVSCK
jgi:calcineurin-like phosphoesterase family protein